MSQSRQTLLEVGQLAAVDGLVGTKKQIVTLTAARTIAVAESGSVFLLDATSANLGYTITLPAVATAGSGWHCKFIVIDQPSATNYVITEATASDTNVVYGAFAESDVTAGATAARTAGTAATQVNLVAGTIQPGDYVDVVGDGTNWYVTGLGQTDAAITIT